MGLAENIEAVKAGADVHSQNFFLFFYKEYPEILRFFPDFQNKSDAELREMRKFQTHTKKVVTLLLAIVERSGEPGRLKEDCGKIIAHPKHTGLKLHEYEQLFEALLAFLQKTLGDGCATSDWQNVATAFLGELKNQGLK